MSESNSSRITYGKGMTEGKEKPLPPIWLGILRLLLSVIVIIGIILGFLFLLQRSSPKEVTIPKIEGFDQPAAEILLRHAGLHMRVAGHRPHDTIEKGKVIETIPASGKTVKQGRHIDLIISAGSNWTNAPDIREMSERRARALLTDKALYLGQVRRVYHAQLPEGFIIAQLPAPGTRLIENSEVQAVISKGPRPDDPVSSPRIQTQPETPWIKPLPAEAIIEEEENH